MDVTGQNNCCILFAPFLSLQRSTAVSTGTAETALLTSDADGAMMNPTLGWDPAAREASRVT